MTVHISDSAIFYNSWGTPELRALFDDKTLVAGWIEVMVALAETEAEFDLIPKPAAQQLAVTCASLVLDETFFTEAHEDFETTNHSLLGLIRAVQRRCPGDSGEWLCYGATVQDITDTHTARILLKVHEIFTQQVHHIVDTLRDLAERYKDTPMCGRTHGQPGLPITFGFKSAGWLDEFMRHGQRLQETKTRLGVGQLAGGVGSLASFGPKALELQAHFFEKLGLQPAAIAWTASRDRLAEWLNLLTLMTATADRIGHEIYNLQRPELGEVREGFVTGTVGSITMPHKRNPEISEHLGTLSRQVRYHAAQMNENLVHDHERDGRAWKSEWVILPEACLCTGKALALLHNLLLHLDVDTARMCENLQATRGFIYTERIMLALAVKLGKQSAHSLVYRLAMQAIERGTTLQEAIHGDVDITRQLGGIEEIVRLFDLEQAIGECARMVERALARSVTDNQPDY
jgi:adenylosuccinate lyase